jgi:hypothetical protein
MSWIVNFYGAVGDVMSFGVSGVTLQTRPFDSLVFFFFCDVDRLGI